MDKMRATLVCCNSHTHNLNSSNSYQYSACLLHGNIPANIIMTAQIGKACSNHNTINQSVSELRLWGTSKWRSALLYSLRERCS